MVGTARGVHHWTKSQRAAFARAGRAAIDRQAADAATAEHHRRTDPVERAKTFLRRRGLVCFAASVLGGPADKTAVGKYRRLMDSAELIAYAATLGFVE